MSDPTIIPPLPLRDDITTARTLSIIVAVLMGVMSLAGLVFPDRIYRSEELIQSFMANDVVNLLIGLPILVWSVRRTRQGKLIGLLFWPGALLYALYNYVAYVFGMPLSLLTVVNLAIVLLSAYSIFDVLRSIDSKSVREQLADKVPERIAGWVLVVFGIVFLFRAVGIIVDARANQTVLPASEIGVLIADLVVSTIWIAGGASLLRRMPLGYVSGMGLLLAGSTLFIGLVAFLLLQPALTDAPLAVTDVIVVFTMGLICFIPFGLFLRGVVSISGETGS